MSGASKCKHCSADVIFIKDQNGIVLPVNKLRVRIYDERPDGWVFAERPGKPYLVYISHFVTCPKYSKAAKRMYGGES